MHFALLSKIGDFQTGDETGRNHSLATPRRLTAPTLRPHPRDVPQTYPWRRFWCPREGSYRLSVDGFLEDVGARYRRFTQVKTFSEIADTPVLILLGEPGIGKTFAMEAEQAAIKAAVSKRGEGMLWPDLQSISTEEAFRDAVVDAPEFRSWIGGDATLHLYLDALDECMLRVRTLGRLLTRALRAGRPERLSLRLACRTAEWSNELERDLHEFFGSDRVKAFELLPLTKDDVASAVQMNGIDTTAFFDYVRGTGAGALASRPVPLEFLIRCFRRNELPATQVDLYERGCLTLCEESEHRRETGLEPALAPEHRLMIAKRLAASMVFGTRATILLGQDDADVPSDAIRLHEVCGGTERTGFSRFEVTERGVRDALDTGLFTSRGAKILGWAHHTYQEYLAACYISDSPLSAEQLLPLVVHPDDPDRKLTPQLHGVAAWLAALHPEIFEYVAEYEPELLLLSDVVLERDADRARIVAELLQRRREQKLAHIDVLVLPKLGKFAHPGIKEQLQPILQDTTAPEDLRRFAADIAEYTKCTALVPLLTTIALDTTTPVELRVDAASAVVRIGTTVERTALKPLLEGPGDSRQERWLIRLALNATWPEALSPMELFQTLSGEHRRLGGVSDDFMLAEHVIESLQPVHLSEGLQWVLRRVRSTPDGRFVETGDALQELENAILIRAWESEDAAALELFAEIAVEKIRRHEALITRNDSEQDFEQRLRADAARRRRLAAAVLRISALSEPPIQTWLLFEETAYLQSDDVDWLLGRQTGESRATKEEQLDAEVILRLANLTDPATFEAVYAASSRNAALSTRVAELCAPVALDSKAAEYAREERDAAEARARSATREQRQRQRRPVQVLERLLASERQPASFWQLLEELSRSAESHHTDLMKLDVQEFPGWIDADADTRRRVIAAAERYVRECDPGADAWFGTQQFTHSAIGGVRALMLLMNAAANRFTALGADVWRTWTPALLGIPNNDARVPLLTFAYAAAPDEVIRRVQELVRGTHAHIVHKLGDVLDDSLAEAIVAALRDANASTKTVGHVLEALLTTPAAQEYAAGLVRDAENQELAITAAAALLLSGSDDAWEVIRPAIAASSAFGQAVVERAVGQDHFDAKPVYGLSESHVADLYLWLCHEYPPETDIIHEGGYTPDTRDNISSWRSRCLDSLKHRGTIAACDALRRLAGALPEQHYLAPLIVEAKANRRAKSWQPTPVAVLRELLTDRTRRQVRSEVELAGVILESLHRLQAKLQGETPAAFDVWNTSPIYKPRTENELTDYVARFLRSDLQDRGVIIGREVEIRRPSAPGTGERTDIHVDVTAKTPDGPGVLSVIVEAKGCWNRGVITDLAAQLAHRYLDENHTRTGVYLVGWFRSSVWDESDYRKAACRHDREALVAVLAAEAAGLRAEGFDIRPVLLDCSLR